MALSLLLAVPLAGCSNKSNSQDGGTSSDGGNGGPRQDAGTDAGMGADAGPGLGMGTAGGSEGFNVASAVVIWSALDGGTDPSNFSVFLTSLARTDFCARFDQASAQMGSIFADFSGVAFLFASPDGQALIPATYPVATAAMLANTGPDGGLMIPDGGLVELLRFENHADGGTDVLNVDQGGTVTVTGVTLGTVLPDGGSGGGEVAGTYNASLTLDGGSTGTLTGGFRAAGCR